MRIDKSEEELMREAVKNTSLDGMAALGARINKEVGPWKNVFDFGTRLVTSKTFRENFEKVLDPTTRDGGLGAVLLSSYIPAAWHRHGMNVFKVSKDLAAALLLTRPPKFDPEDFRLPYESFKILLPEGVLPLWRATGRVWAEDITVSCYDASMHDDEPKKMLYIAANYGVLSLWRQKELAKLDQVTPFDQESVIEVPSVASAPDSKVREDEITERIAVHLLQNLVHWVNNCSRGVKEVAKGSSRQFTNRKIAHKPKPVVWSLGREVKLSPASIEAARELALGESKDAVKGWKVRTQFTVRGHWRNQAHGPGRKDRKKIWIAPHQKGPDGAESWAHVYTDKQAKSDKERQR